MPKISQVGQTIRNVKRYQEILTVLFRYGFEEFIADTKLDQWIGFRKGQTRDALPEEGQERIPHAVRIRRVLEELGPTFVKMGQVLSTRPDLIPLHWAEEFKQLQDNCPCMDFEIIRTLLEKEFPDQIDEMFQSIEQQPLAAASMAQVHRAVFKDGQKVVLKVLRPGVRRTIATDMDVLHRLAEFVEWHFEELGYSATDVINEFSQELKKESDLTHEGRSTDRLREYFETDPDILFPKVFWETTTRNVITLEEIKGTALSRIDLDTLSADQRRQIVETGARAVFQQCLQYGFFHADPHPGNIFVLPEGRLCFVDCGMTGHIDSRTAGQLADLLHGVVSSDLDRVISVVIALTDADPALAKNRRFREDLWKLLLQLQVSSLNRIDVKTLLDEFFLLLRNFRIHCPADLVLLLKALTTVEGVAREVDSSFDLIAYMRPYIEELVAKRYGISAFSNRFQKTLLRYIELAEDLPVELQGLLAQLRGNHFSVSLEHKNLDRLTHSIEHSSRNVAYALIVSGLLVGSSLLTLAGRMSEERALFSLLGLIGLGAGALLTVFLLISNYRHRK